MEKRSFSVSELYSLDVELNGFVNPDTGERVVKGILSEKIKLGLKFHLTSLSKKVTEELKTIQDLRNELIKKHGEEDENGSVKIPNTITEDGKEILNPKLKLFTDEFKEFLTEKKEFDIPELFIKDFEDLETENSYEILQSLMK
jgi:hypothetical protein